MPPSSDSERMVRTVTVSAPVVADALRAFADAAL
jgi:hypothetical protein